MSNHKTKSGRSLLSHVLTGMGFVVTATIMMALLHDTWLVRRLEARNLDSIFLLLHGAPSDDIRVVEIDRDDFHTRFGGISPLDPRKVAELVQIVDKGGARAIGVDILTDEWPEEIHDRIQTRAPVVWVRGGDKTNGVATISPKLSGNGTIIRQGPPVLIQVDGQVGFYKRWVAVPGEGLVPSFTTELLHAAQTTLSGKGSAAKTEESNDTELDIPFLVKNSSLLRIATSHLPSRANPDFAASHLFDGKIVLIGGGFPESKDEYQTAFGSMYGVEILANIVNAEWAHRRVQRASEFVLETTDLIFGLLLVLATYRFAPVRMWRLLCLMACVAILALGLSVGLYVALGIYISFVPVVLGVIAHSVFEHANHHRQLLKQVEAMTQ